jgi:hypothetical protein
MRRILYSCLITDLLVIFSQSRLWLQSDRAAHSLCYMSIADGSSHSNSTDRLQRTRASQTMPRSSQGFCLPTCRLTSLPRASPSYKVSRSYRTTDVAIHRRDSCHQPMLEIQSHMRRNRRCLVSPLLILATNHSVPATILADATAQDARLDGLEWFGESTVFSN